MANHFNAVLPAKGEKVESAEDNEGRTAEARVRCQEGTHAFCVLLLAS